MYLVYCIEVPNKDYAKANEIMEKYDYNNDIVVRSLNPSRLNGIDTVQYWFTATCSDDIPTIVNELKSNGIDVF